MVDHGELAVCGAIVRRKERIDDLYRRATVPEEPQTLRTEDGRRECLRRDSPDTGIDPRDAATHG
jgi:hypothetical protein